MNKEFIPYNESLDLKNLGFDEPCLACYNTDKHFFIRHMGNCLGVDDYERNSGINPDFGIFSCPTFSQAFRWIRENYGLYFEIYPNDTQFVSNATEWFFIIKKGTTTTNDSPFKSYEEAELACLKELIGKIKI